MKIDQTVKNRALTAEDGAIFLTGIQALVRLPMDQRRRDRRNGLNTAGLVSGYRGSPLGAYDQQLWKAERLLADHDIVFQPGLNEDLAATALWGAQMHAAFGRTKVDGVFGIWYGKGPGVDRTGDVFRTANVHGTSPLGGVLAVAGDDHAAQSSMFPHQTDGIFQSVMMPMLQPATVGEILSLGLAGIELSRFSGLWVGLKAIAEVVESAATVDVARLDEGYLTPRKAIPSHGLNWDRRIAWPEQRAELERRLVEERLPAAIAWARLNRVDRPVIVGAGKRLCVVTVGKAHQDFMQAVDNLSLDAGCLAALGVSVYKVAMSWPLDAESIVSFASGFDEILIVEEKQPIVESQIKAAFYHQEPRLRPRIVGKTDERGAPLLPATLEFSAALVTRVFADRLGEATVQARSHALVSHDATGISAALAAFPKRTPFFCSGCPHNTSTRTPDGSISGGGIGCHTMALSLPELKTTTFSQMGGEGAQWLGAAPFSASRHIFQNLGDGTYQHSGVLAIRAAVAGKANITFKILYNDAVAMTGGQPAEGLIDPLRISRQLEAEGVRSTRLVSDRPEKWVRASGLAAGARVHHRDELDAVQRELREIEGVTAIIYEQTCAAEKRRRRKRAAFDDPPKRLYINPRVCEGCGDCSIQSNCIALEPLETEFGRKRRINQSSCNKDFSCVKGFCPSFVEIDDPVVRKPDGERLTALEGKLLARLTEPAIAIPGAVFNIYVAGIGGMGVLTLGAIIGAAAHFDGLSATVLDFTGLAQKNGAVISQIRIAGPTRPIHAVRIGAGEMDVLLGTDVVSSCGIDALTKIGNGRSALVLNTNTTPTADVVRQRDATPPTSAMIDALAQKAGGAPHTLRATALAEGLFGDSVAANMLLLGYAWQKGLIPVSADAIRAAVKANGAAIKQNLRAFEWGRVAAIDLPEVESVANVSRALIEAPTTEHIIQRNAKDLSAYQNANYASRYLALIEQARSSARRFGSAVATHCYKLMAYKDEYEVARLYADPSFKAALAEQFSDARRLSVYLAPPLISSLDKKTGRPKKRKFGPWIFPVFALLAKGKALRGTWADPFGYTEERRAERRLVGDYFDLMARICENLSEERLPTAIELASLPGDIRGYGPVKDQAIMTAAVKRSLLFERFEMLEQPKPAEAAITVPLREPLDQA